MRPSSSTRHNSRLAALALAVSLAFGGAAHASPSGDAIELGYNAEVRGDHAAAIEHYRMARNAGSQEAAARMGWLLLTNPTADKHASVEENKDTGWGYLVSAADAGDPVAQTYVGDAWSRGLHKKASPKDARRYYQMAASQGYAPAASRLAAMTSAPQQVQISRTVVAAPAAPSPPAPSVTSITAQPAVAVASTQDAAQSAALQREIAQERAARGAANEQAERLQAQLVELEENEALLKKSSSSSKAQLAKAQEQIAAVKKQAEEAVAERAEAERLIARAEAAAQDLTLANERLVSQRDTISGERDTLNDEVAKLKAELAKVQNDHREEIKQYQGLETKLAAANEARIDALAQVEVARGDLKIAEEGIVAAQRSRSAMSAELESVTSQLVAARDTSSNTETLVDVSALPRPEAQAQVAAEAKPLPRETGEAESVRTAETPKVSQELRWAQSGSRESQRGLDALRRSDVAGGLAILREQGAGGDSDALTNLAVMYATGNGVPSNAQMALELLAAAARDGNEDAIHNLRVLGGVKNAHAQN